MNWFHWTLPLVLIGVPLLNAILSPFFERDAVNRCRR